MLDDLDQALEQLLIREMPITNGEVDVKFDQPKREWSARLSRPTVNLFLYDVRENQKLRQAQPLWDVLPNPDGTVTRRRKPVRLDLHYMLTAWAAEPDDEHRLLGRALMALFRYSHLPEELVPESLGRQPAPLSFLVAQYDELRNPTDVWNVLDNEMRPGIALVITLALDPYAPTVAPLVRTRELRMGPSQRPYLEALDAGVEPDLFWTIGGTVHSDQPLDPENTKLVLVEKGRQVSLRPDGRFAIGGLEAGDYTLEVIVDGQKSRQYPITVPAADSDLVV
jgi:hypothetical protein